MGSNIRLYRSLNTRPTPTSGLTAQLNRCMIAYSSATNDDQVGKVTPVLLQKVFTKDKRLKPISPTSLAAVGKQFAWF